jgi:hypothetical protein
MTAIPTMMLNDVAKTPVLLTALEAQGYTHLVGSAPLADLNVREDFSCCGSEEVSETIRVLRPVPPRCPRCFHRTSPELFKTSKGIEHVTAHVADAGLHTSG